MDEIDDCLKSEKGLMSEHGDKAKLVKNKNVKQRYANDDRRRLKSDGDKDLSTLRGDPGSRESQ